MFLRATTGGFDVIRVETSRPDFLTVLLKEKYTEQLQLASLAVTDASPARIVSLDVQPTPRPKDLAIPRLTESSAIAALKARLDSSTASGEFSGVFLVARHGKTLMSAARGIANQDTHAVITLDTRFDVASVSKIFTAVATLQLVESGKLGLDDTLAKYIPEYQNRDLASKVSIRHLLTHTGGTGGFPSQQVRSTLLDHASYVRALSARPPVFEPGLDYQYSNYGYVLLGAIIERVSGTAYEDYVARHILAPAGMHATSMVPSDDLFQKGAKNYTHRGGRLERTGEWAGGRVGWIPGQLYSTAGDLLAFARALDSGKLVSKRMLAQATTPAPGRRYALGFVVRGQGQLRNYGHGGGAAGVNSDVRIFPNLGVIIVGISNFDQPAVDRLVDYYGNRMPLKSSRKEAPSPK